MTERQKLKEVMHEKGWSVADLARVLDLKPAYVKQVLKESNPNALPAWAKALIYK